MHGIKRIPNKPDQKSAKEINKINEYKLLNHKFKSLKASNELTVESLNICNEILSQFNLDNSTIINFKLRILFNLRDELKPDDLVGLLVNELNVNEQLLKTNLKFYSFYNYRKSLIKVLFGYLDTQDSKLFQLNSEFNFIAELLKFDDRNFHVWNYKRFLLDFYYNESVIRGELKFTLNLLQANFSNYSAWHHRCFIYKLLWSRGINIDELKFELELVLNGLYTDPSDQSIWLYQSWLLSLIKENKLTDLLDNQLNLILQLDELEPNHILLLKSLLKFYNIYYSLTLNKDYIEKFNQVIESLIKVDEVNKFKYLESKI